MPVYDDPDYAWKQMVKKSDINDPFANPSEELKEAMEKIKEYERKAKEQLLKEAMEKIKEYERKAKEQLWKMEK